MDMTTSTPGSRPARYTADELEFMPDVLALQETPVSPLARMGLWACVALVVSAGLWVGLGRLEVTAMAQGRVVATSGIQQIQPAETAVISRVLVREGDSVRAGQLLVELDATDPQATQAQLAAQTGEALLKVARGRGLARAVHDGRLAELTLEASSAEIPADRRLQASLLARSTWSEYQAQRARLQAELGRILAERETVQAELDSRIGTLGIAERRAQDLKNLVAQNFVSQHGYLDREEIRLTREGEVRTLKARLLELGAEAEGARRQLDELSTGTLRAALELADQGEQALRALAEEQRKVATRLRQSRLVAPVDGTVQQLAVRTVGGVVTPAQVLMQVVPANADIEVEATVENKDAGFIHPGQSAQVKVETFQFTKYGLLDAEVTSISRDAVLDPQRGPIYTVRLKLRQRQLERDGRQYPITPGLAVTADLSIGERPVYEYFLGTFIQAAHDSLRER